MRIVIAATVAAAGGLVAAGVLGVATAETPTLPPPRTVSVGEWRQAISQSASAAVATAVYRQGMADAVTDGQAKAQFLASKVGATLGPVQSMVEGGGCSAVRAAMNRATSNTRANSLTSARRFPYRRLE